MKHIAFLHTSAVHVDTFQALVTGLASDVTVDHVVREDLLRDARILGADHADVSPLVTAAMSDAAAAGAAVVVCTCSTIGGVAERADIANGVRVMRIDRPMADAAVAAGTRVLVVAALQSTLEPTVELIRDSAYRAGKAVVIERHWVATAWPLFEAGDTGAYVRALADDVRALLPGPDVVVLAQASMAGAAALLTDVRVPVLSSPAMGVRAALGVPD